MPNETDFPDAERQRYKLIATALSDIYSGVLFVTEAGRIEFANQAFCDRFGLKDAPADLLGLASRDMIEKIKDSYLHPDAAVARIREIIAAGQPVRDEEIAMRGGRTVLRDFIPLKADGKSYGRLWTHLDITERKQAEETLRQTSQRLLLASRAGGVGIWDYDVVNNKLIWDDQMYSLYGITPEKFGGAYEAWRGGLHPEDVRRGDDEIQMALRGEKKFDTEFRVLWPDGTIRHIRALAIVQRDASGRPLRMIGTNWDTTERNRAEEELRKAHAELRQGYRDLFDSITIGLCRTTPGPEGTFINANPAMVKMFEADDLAQLMALHPSKIYADESQRKIVSDSLMRKGFIDAIVEMRTLKGRQIWCRMTSIKRSTPEGEVYFNNTIEDVTEHKKADTELESYRQHLEDVVSERTQALEESKASLERSLADWNKTFDSISDLVFLQDRDFNITRANKAFADMMKMKPEEIVGRKCYELLHKRDSPWPACPFERTKKDGLPHVEEVDDPAIGLPLLVTTSPILDDQGQCIGSVHIAKDISEMKKTHAELDERIRDLERFYKVAIDRETKMIALKKELKELKERTGPQDPAK